MISKDDIESKDFSLVLPELIGKVQAVGSSLLNAGYIEGGFCPNDDFMVGFGAILNEVADDLRVINEALHSSKGRQ